MYSTFEMRENYLIYQKCCSSLAQELQESYNTLIDLILSLSPALYSVKKIQGTGGAVSVINILAYQIGWGNLLVYWYESGLLYHHFDMPAPGFLKWDYVALAHHFYEKYESDVETQIRDLQKLVQKIIALVEKEHKAGNLDTLGVWNWCTLPSGKKWPLSKWVKVNTVSPYKRALSLIKKL